MRARARKLGFEEREVLDVDARFDRSRLVEATQSTSLFASQRLIDLRLNTKPTRELGDALRELLPRLDEGTRVLISSAFFYFAFDDIFKGDIEVAPIEILIIIFNCKI